LLRVARAVFNRITLQTPAEVSYAEDCARWQPEHNHTAIVEPRRHTDALSTTGKFLRTDTLCLLPGEAEPAPGTRFDKPTIDAVCPSVCPSVDTAGMQARSEVRTDCFRIARQTD
jgi:hypothetical protein